MKDESRPEIVGGKANACNYLGENAIRRMFKDGSKAKVISDALMIEESCVKSVIDDYKKNKEKYDVAMEAAVPRPIVREPSADEVFGDADPLK